MKRMMAQAVAARVMAGAVSSVGLMLAPALAQPPAYPNTSAMGSMGDTHAAWYRLCMSVQQALPPARDMPPAGALHGMRPCGAQDRYYDTRQQGSASPAAWEQVRHCAIAEDDSAVLMMLYANGYGVSRNNALALKYACALPAAPAEMDSRVAHLQERAVHYEPQPFDQCDDVASSQMGGQCAAIQERQDSRTRTGKVSALLKSWTPEQQAAAARLQTALDLFASTRAAQETDMSSGLRAAMAIEARGADLDMFTHDLQEAEKGRLPRYTPQQYQQLERKLNALYERLLQRGAARNGQQGEGKDGSKENKDGNSAQGVLGNGGTVTKEGMRATQRAWQAYRDAWVVLGAARYPGVAAHCWKALLTQRRIDQLAEFDT